MFTARGIYRFWVKLRPLKKGWKKGLKSRKIIHDTRNSCKPLCHNPNSNTPTPLSEQITIFLSRTVAREIIKFLRAHQTLNKKLLLLMVVIRKFLQIFLIFRHFLKKKVNFKIYKGFVKSLDILFQFYSCFYMP